MMKLGNVLVLVVAVVCLNHLRSSTFVPSHPSRSLPAVAGAMTMLGASSAAFADEIDTAAAKLSKASYPFLKQVNWLNDYYATIPESDPKGVLQAIEKALVMGAAMDPAELKKGVLAHSAAIKNIDKDGVTTLKDYEKINSAIGHMIASAGEQKTMDVYNAFASLVPAKVPVYLKSTVNGKDAEAAYNALLEFKDVVKSKASSGVAAPPSRTPDAIDAAAKKLSDASYPFMKEVDWSASYYRDLPGLKPLEGLKAVGKALDMGAAMDSNSLREGVLAHAKAIGSIDAKGVLPLDDFVAINSAIGHMVASAGTQKTMGVYDAFKKLVPTEVPSYLMSTVNANDAQVAYKALMEFKDVVKTR